MSSKYHKNVLLNTPTTGFATKEKCSRTSLIQREKQFQLKSQSHFPKINSNFSQWCLLFYKWTNVEFFFHFALSTLNSNRYLRHWQMHIIKIISICLWEQLSVDHEKDPQTSASTYLPRWDIHIRKGVLPPVLFKWLLLLALEWLRIVKLIYPYLRIKLG